LKSDYSILILIIKNIIVIFVIKISIEHNFNTVCNQCKYCWNQLSEKRIKNVM